MALGFPILEAKIGGFVFLIFGGCNFASATYFYFRAIETKNVESVVTFEKFAERTYF